MAINSFVGTLLLWLCCAVFSGCAATGQTKPDDPVKLRAQAVQAYRDGRYAAAVAGFEELVAAMPKDSELWFRLGNAYAKARKPDQAVQAYREALLRNPEYGKAWYNLGMMHMQEALKAFIDMGKYVSPTDPASRAAEKKRQALFLILQQNSPEE
jgi:tetratricopeptide (TPR) repeat protein